MFSYQIKTERCVFEDQPNTPITENPEERRFTCIHGKTLRWSKARAALGLKPEIDPGLVLRLT